MKEETKKEKRETISTGPKSIRDSFIWEKAKKMVLSVYRYTNQLPWDEEWVLKSQMRRAAVSVPSNIAEGYNRFSKGEKRQFLAIAYGSVGELEAQLEIARELYPRIPADEAASLADEVSRMLNSIIKTHF